jgi:hypothetical protein
MLGRVARWLLLLTLTAGVIAAAVSIARGEPRPWVGGALLAAILVAIAALDASRMPWRPIVFRRSRGREPSTNGDESSVDNSERERDTNDTQT